MTQSYDRIQDDRNISEAQREWDSPIDFNPNSNAYTLFEALLSEADRIDEELESIYEQQHIESATGSELDSFGRLVDVSRNTGEGDDKYRARIKAAFRASTMSATYDEFAEYASSVLNTSVDNLGFTTNYGADPATVVLDADPSIYDNVNLTASDVAELLGKGVPAGHEVKVQETGTFRLKSDGDTDDASKGLTADNITTGGTLAADLT